MFLVREIASICLELGEKEKLKFAQSMEGRLLIICFEVFFPKRRGEEKVSIR